LYQYPYDTISFRRCCPEEMKHCLEGSLAQIIKALEYSIFPCNQHVPNNAGRLWDYKATNEKGMTLQNFRDQS
ncbi:MAG: hypothetical protein LUB61_01830, partial [Eggerthellaceae bacterium]|nr:hypothetical protein [Eggerthellaceae bacterium]